MFERFYRHHIEGAISDCEIVRKFQKRFEKYREALFLFLTEDGIPWNNNMAERAIRHFAVQRKISGSFYEQGAIKYLRLLGIAQSCRFQNKSFFKFLLSEERDVDSFKSHTCRASRNEPTILLAQRRVMRLISMKGTQGASHTFVSQMAKLSAAELQTALDGLVQSGEVAVIVTDGLPTYRRLV